jgi:polysaccharide deacetylase 2 family uncharacterized protein YibQ
VRHAFWLLVIAFSITALCGGYLSGRAAVPRFPSAAASATPIPVGAIEAGPLTQTDELARDEFARDSAVILDTAGADPAKDATLAIVIVDAGHSVALESPFLNLGIPVTLVLDPAAPAARALGAAAHDRGDSVFIQARAPLTAAQVDAIHSRYPRASGVAVQIEGPGDLSHDSLMALHADGLHVFDEYGETNVPAHTRAAGVRFTARSITVDDHLQRAYVRYMLRQAVHLARGRTAFVMARPFPGTLQAFEDLLARASRDGVRFVGLP